jgi:translocation protein SEC72
MSQHHGHSHGPPQIQQVASGQSPQQQQIRSAPDPVLQAAIEADFKPVSFEFADHDGRKNAQALCKEHKLHVCQKCGIDWQPLNALAAMFSAAPPDAILPPPGVVQPARTQAVNKTKDEGNVSDTISSPPPSYPDMDASA